MKSLKTLLVAAALSAAFVSPALHAQDQQKKGGRGMPSPEQQVARLDEALTLTADQLRHVDHHVEKSNAKFRDDYLDGDRAERLRKLVQRTVERAETVYGALGEAQREAIAQRLAASPFDAELWFAERQARQRDARALLARIANDDLSKEQVIAAVRAWVATANRSPREAYRRYVDQLEQFNCRFAATLHNATTPAQRQHGSTSSP